MNVGVAVRERRAKRLTYVLGRRKLPPLGRFDQSLRQHIQTQHPTQRPLIGCPFHAERCRLIGLPGGLTFPFRQPQRQPPSSCLPSRSYFLEPTIHVCVERAHKACLHGRAQRSFEAARQKVMGTPCSRLPTILILNQTPRSGTQRAACSTRLENSGHRRRSRQD